MQTLHVIDIGYKNFPHQTSGVEQTHFGSETFEDTKIHNWNRFPGKGTTNVIQKDLYFLHKMFCSVSDQARLVEKPVTSQLLIILNFSQ